MNEPENKSATTPDDVATESAPEVASVETATSDEAVSESTTDTTEPSVPVTDIAVENASETSESEASETKSFKWQYYLAAGAVVVVIILGVLYVMDTQGRINVPVFTGIQNLVAKQTSVASVNGTDISEYDFNVSVAQITTGARAQGADLGDPELQSQINAQAIEMLVNTELLKQEALRRGISITDEAVTERLSALEAEVGGAEVLRARMNEFNIDDKTLRRDIYNELTIQTLLDQVFEETAISITEEEVQSLYAGAGGAEAGLPPLEEVREQVEAQIRTGKEQEVVTTFLQTLRETATIEVLI